MVLNREDIHRNRAISVIITFLIFGSILLFLILKNIISQNPPFPNGGEQSYLGLIGMSIGESKESNLSEAVKIKSQVNISGNINGEIVNVEERKVRSFQTETEKLIAKFEKSHQKNKNKIQANNSENNGNEANGTSLTGTKTGTGSVSINGYTSENIGIYMERRTVIAPPKLLSDTKEEGKVVVDIVVDNKGIVIEADPNGRGTTTSSSSLKQKAKQAALETKFSANEKLDEQRGTITIVFAFE